MPVERVAGTEEGPRCRAPERPPGSRAAALSSPLIPTAGRFGPQGFRDITAAQQHQQRAIENGEGGARERA
ncbi:hypothetical protein GCM10010505_35750 [Kitasatospora aburaviensis]